MGPIIKLEDVDFYYDKGKPAELHALNQVNLEINQGEFVSFFGPSGCGKSTLLYIIAGIEKPDTGKILVNGRDLMDFMPKELAIYRQMGIGLIFQNFNLIPSISILENVMLPMAFLGISEDKRHKRAMELFERLDMTDLAKRFPFELSGGQQQRVGIARALANDPPIILADEPTGNLDSPNATKTMELLREFNEKEGKTIILVTHEAWSLSYVGKIFYMKDGAVTKVEEQKSAVAKGRTDKMFKGLHPELPTVEVRAKTLASFVLRGYPDEVVKRLEYFLTQRFKGQIDHQVLRQLLDRPYGKGGVGLWRQKAAKISEYVEKIINEEFELSKLYKKLEKNPETPLYEEVERIKKWLLEDTTAKLVPIQADRLHEVIEERIRNIITPDNFEKLLNMPKSDGGIGFKIGTSMRIAERLEALISKDEANLVKT